MFVITVTESTLGWLTQTRQGWNGNRAVGKGEKRRGPSCSQSVGLLQWHQCVTINWYEPFPSSSFHSVKRRECHYWRGISTPHCLARDTLTDRSWRKESDRRLHSRKKQKNDKGPYYAMIQARRGGGCLLGGSKNYHVMTVNKSASDFITFIAQFHAGISLIINSSPFEKSRVVQLAKKPHPSSEPKGSLPCSQQPATRTYPQPYESIHSHFP